MSFNTKWDVDKYKTEYESDEHWQLRRCFMETHKNKFPEERLVCLAQVFTNIEFMGCRYPAETMELVGQLSQGVADGFREKQKTKLKRTFIKASDAAGAKAKGLKRSLGDAANPSDSPPKIPKCTDNNQLPHKNILNISDVSKCSGNIQLLQTTSSITETIKGLENKQQQLKITSTATPWCSEAKQLPHQRVSSTSWVVTNKDTKDIKNTSTACQVLKSSATVRVEEPQKEVSKEETDQQESNDIEMNGCEKTSLSLNKHDNMLIKEAKTNRKSNGRRVKKVDNDFQRFSRELDGEGVQSGPYGKLILFEFSNQEPFQVLQYSTAYCRIPFKIEYSTVQTSTFCKVFVNNHLLTSAYGFSKKEARNIATEDAYDKLKQICYVLKIKSGIYEHDPVIERDELEEAQHGEANSTEKPLEENIGSKMMRAMGWTGGGLGKEQQGIQEPVRASIQLKRSGFGLQNSSIDGQSKEFRKNVYQRLSEYKEKRESFSLTFSSEFTREERKIAHEVCRALRLKSKSYGKGQDRRLVVSYKKNFCEIVEKMLLAGEYSNARYQLIKPPIALPPENETLVQPTCENNVKCEDAIVSPIEPSAQIPKDQPPPDVNDEPLENISSVIVKPADVAGKNIDDGVTQKCSDGITGPFGCLVLIEDETVVTPIQLIERSANGCHIPFKFEYGNVGKGGMICRLLINNVLVASSTEVSKKRARQVTVTRSLKILKDVCCTIKTQIKVVDGSISIIKCLKKPNKRSVGCGKDSETHIVCVSKEVDWSSLCMGQGIKILTLTGFKDKVKHFLRKYQEDSCPYDLVFTPEFSANEKSLIQKIASSLALKIIKFDASGKEYMVINKKLSSIELAKAMLTSGGNISADSFQLGDIFLL